MASLPVNFIALSVLVFLFAVANGQEDDLACNDTDAATSHFNRASNVDCFSFVRCDGRKGVLVYCAAGTLYDSRLGVCNYPEAVTCHLHSCTLNQRRTRKGPCSDMYSVCIQGASSGLQIRTCPEGRYFNPNNENDPCGSTMVIVNDTQFCGRPSKLPVNNAPVVNCSMKADPNNICKFITVSNGIESGSQWCATGTEFNQNACTCTHSKNCFKKDNETNESSKQPDSIGRASWVMNFQNVVGSKPPVYTERPDGNLVKIASYVESQGVEFAGQVAYFTQGLNSQQPSFLYAWGYAGNQLNVPFFALLTLKASTSQQNFNIMRNNHYNQCQATISLTGTYNGGQYTFALTITGAIEGSTANVGTNQASSSISISANSDDWVQIVVEFNGQANVHARNLGSNQNSRGTVVSGTPTSRLGDRIAYNFCGLEFFYGFTGYSSKIALYEGTTVPNFGRLL